MNKSELRKKYKLKRSLLSKEEVENNSIAIANQVLKLDIWKYETYHIFLAIEDLNEVNTEYLLHLLQGKDKNIVISKSNFSDCTMKHYLLTDNTLIKKNKWGIPEPENGIAIDPSAIDVVFVPLLAFDSNGNRVGYGKGFYDKFLTSVEPKKIIGISFFPPEKAIFDVSNLDKAMDICVLPDKTIHFV